MKKKNLKKAGLILLLPILSSCGAISSEINNYNDRQNAIAARNENSRYTLQGGWYNTQVVDSTVIAFESSSLKEYVFVKGTSTIQRSLDYGEYTITDKITLKDSIGSSHPFQIYGDKLTIEWKSPRKATTYTRIKD